MGLKGAPITKNIFSKVAKLAFIKALNINRELLLKDEAGIPEVGPRAFCLSQKASRY